MKSVLLGVVFACGLLAQNSGIQGLVTDSSKALIQAATVTVTNLDTGVETNAASNEQGLYRVPLLGAGRYKVECHAPGFAAKTVGELRLETGQAARLDFELQPGAVSQSIEVSAAAVLLNSETSEMGQVIDSKRILEMPLNGRNYLQLAQFTAGVLPGGNSETGVRARDEGAFASAGSHVAQNNILLDGNDNSSRTGGGPLGYEAQQVKPPVDAVAEFKVVTNNISAEYGYRAGAKILVTTKSGGNEFHGSAYEFLRNEKLDGTNFFANRSGATKPTYRQNQFGATLGGPVIKNRTFFFGSYQGTRIRTGQSYLNTVASRDIVERGDFSKQPGTRRNVFDPLTLTGTGAAARRQPFPNNVIPLNRWDPVGKNLIPLYPAANVPGVSEHDPSNYYYSPSDSNDTEQYDVRVDHNFTEKHRFFARYSLRDQFRDEKGYLPYPAMGGWGQTVKLLGHNIASSLTSSLTPVVYNELRFGYSKFDTAFDIPFSENMNKKFGIKNAPGDSMNDGDDYGYSLIAPSGFAQLGPRAHWPNDNNLYNWMITEGLLWQRGKHTLKFGGELRNQTLYRNAARFRRGRFNFNGQFTAEFPNVGSSRSSTGNGLADMLLGYVNGGNYGNNNGEDIRTRYFGFYIQDDWKLTPRLTLNLGLRYEVFGRGTYPDPDKQQVARYLLEGINVPTAAEEKFVFPTSSSDAGGPADKNNFAPRVGLAWSVTGKTVVRAGAGIFYGEGNNLVQEGSNFRAGAPRQIEVSIQTTPVSTSYYLRDGFPTLVTGIVPAGVAAYVFPESRPTLYVSQWFLDVQRTLSWDTLVTIGYLGTKGTQLPVARNINLPRTPDPAVAANQRLMRPQFSSVVLHEAMLNANYNAFTAKAEKRFSKGLTLLSSFTWGHNIDQANEDLFGGGGGNVTDHDYSRERSSSNLDRRFGFVASAVYELPFGKRRKFVTSGPAEWVLGGWQIGGLFSKYTGLAIGHSINVNNQNLGGAVRGDWVRKPELPSSERSIDRWFDTSFVTPNVPGTIGNAGRNLIRAPGRVNMDVMVARSFRMPWEGHQVQFRFESFNFTNTPAFGNPNTGVGTPNAGKITTAEDPRRIQFALKYMF